MSDNMKCPNCRASIPALSGICEYCDTEVKPIKSQHNETLRDLEQKLIEAEDSLSESEKTWHGTQGIVNKQVSMIQTYSVPNSKNELLDLLIHASTTAKSLRGGGSILQGGGGNNQLAKAWDAKATQAYQKLLIMSDGDEKLAKILAPFEAAYGLDNLAKSSSIANKSLDIADTEQSDKSTIMVLIIASLTGLFGGHRFYTGHTGLGWAQLFTMGGCGMWWAVDMMSIFTGQFKDSKGRYLQGSILDITAMFRRR